VTRACAVFFVRILVYLVMHDSELVSLEHLLFSRHPSQSVEPTNPASIIFQEDKTFEDKTLGDKALANMTLEEKRDAYTFLFETWAKEV